MKEWSRHSAAFPVAVILTGLIAACGLGNPDFDPDDSLPRLQLDPQSMVNEVVQASMPDSFGSDTVAQMRFDLTGDAHTAVQNGAVVELVFRVAGGEPEVSGWVEGTAAWVSLEIETVPTLDDSLDNWWREAWIDPLEGERLIATDGSVRFRISPVPRSTQAILRVLMIPSRLKITASIGRVLATQGNGLLLQSADSPTLIRRDTAGDQLGQVISVSPPLSLCFLDDRYYGVDSSELQYLPGSGGTWQRLAVLPWGESSAYALTTDGTDLYLIRRPHQLFSVTPHVLYRLSAEQLRNTFSFIPALLDSTVLERNGLAGGSSMGFAYWSEERHLAVPGRQDDQFGLVTFTRAGRFRKFIPMPFMEMGITFAIVGDYLFVTGAIPTWNAIMWEGRYGPLVPVERLLFRWPTP